MGALLAIVASLAVHSSPVHAAAGDITTVAGSGRYGSPGNGGPATSASLAGPGGVASVSGRFFVSEQGNPYDVSTNQVRVVQNGIINPFAGATIAPINDGAPATQASISRPPYVVVDSAGNLYISDFDRNIIRKVSSATGIATTVAGTPNCGNALYTCSSGFSGDGGPATQALLNTPYGLAVDTTGNLYIADRDNSRVRKVDAATGIITTFAGGGSPADGLGDNGPATAAQLSFPEGIALDATGSLTIDDAFNNRIRRVDATSGIITTVAGDGTYNFGGDGGPATSAQLASPSDVSLDGAGDTFIADSGNCRVRKVDASGVISTVAGSSQCVSAGDGGPATSARLGYPAGVRVNAAGELFIADGNIRKVDVHGIISTVAGNGTIGLSGDGGPATQAQVVGVGLDLDSAGNIFIADQNSSRVRKVDVNGIITTVAGGGVGDGFPATSAQLDGPRGLATDSSDTLYIADCGDNRVRKVDASGVMTSVAGGLGEHGLGDGGPATSAALKCPVAVAFGGGSMYIADTTDNRVRRVDSSGVITTVAGTGSAGFSGDGGAASSAQLSAPSGLAFDTAGNLYIADRNNNRVRRVDTSGTITTIAGNGNQGGSADGQKATSGPVVWPVGLAIGPGGNLTIAESGFASIRSVDAKGIISTMAGNGIPGYSGDGGPGPMATLDDPEGIAYDASGNLLIADNQNGVIRSLAAGTPPLQVTATKKTANCGMTVMQNLTLADDIGPCPGDGLIVGANGVHINLNGHTITGSYSHTGQSVGIRATSMKDAKISGGTVTGFDAGVALISGSNNLVTGMTVANNQGGQNTFNDTYGDGIVMFASSRNTITSNSVVNNGPFDGIAMIGQGADNNLIQNNTVKDTTNFGRPFLPGTGLGIVTNPFLGFDRPRMVSLNANQIIGNTVINNGNAGISTVSNVNGLVSNNLVEHNGFQSSFRGAFPGNGIGVTYAHNATPNTNELVENNQVLGNFRDGIQVVASGNHILNNTGNANGGFDFRDFDRDPVTFQPTCSTNTWSGNVWGTGGFYPACASTGGHQMSGVATLPNKMEPSMTDGTGVDLPPRNTPS